MVLVEPPRVQNATGRRGRGTWPSPNWNRVFEDRSIRIEILSELVGTGYVAGQLGGPESKVLHEIADARHVGRTDKASVDPWVRRQFALLGEARELMEG